MGEQSNQQSASVGDAIIFATIVSIALFVIIVIAIVNFLVMLAKIILAFVGIGLVSYLLWYIIQGLDFKKAVKNLDNSLEEERLLAIERLIAVGKEEFLRKGEFYRVLNVVRERLVHADSVTEREALQDLLNILGRNTTNPSISS